MSPRFLVILSDRDPVARGVAERWGGLPTAWGHVEGTPIRRLTDEVWTLHRPGWHVEDNGLDELLPEVLRSARVPLLFVSLHRSETGPRCFTVHPLGNLTGSAEVGGFPRTLSPTAPRLMASALRRLREAGDRIGIPATYEATHHGPALGHPAFFLEVGGGEDFDRPAPEVLHAIAEAIPTIEEDPVDRVALGVGGGHYMPHFADLALRRHWAFGHLIPRHALGAVEPDVARAAWELTPGAEGILYARAADAERGAWNRLGGRLRDQDAPGRAGPPSG